MSESDFLIGWLADLINFVNDPLKFNLRLYPFFSIDIFLYMFFSDEAGFSLISVCSLCSLGQVFRLLLLFVLFICMFVLALGRFQVFVLPKSGSPTCVDIIFVGRTYEFRTSWISFAFPTLTLLFIISSFMTRRKSRDILTILLPKSYKPFSSLSKVVYLK